MLKFFNGSFAVFCYEYDYENPLIWKNGGWRLVLCSLFKKKCNWLSSILDLNILT